MPSKNNHNPKLIIYGGYFCVFLALAIINTNALGQAKRYERDFTSSQFKAKFERLKSSSDRVDRLKEKGNISGAIKEARESVAIAEEEFGALSSMVVRPTFTLIDLLGEKRLYAEAEENFKKIFAITDSGEETSMIYAASYRIRIAELYLKWNLFDKAEILLLEAKDTIRKSKMRYQTDQRYRFDSDYLGSYSKTIEDQLQKINDLKEMNKFNKSDKEP